VKSTRYIFKNGAYVTANQWLLSHRAFPSTFGLLRPSTFHALSYQRLISNRDSNLRGYVRYCAGQHGHRCGHGAAPRWLSVVDSDWPARTGQSSPSICLPRRPLNSPTTSTARALSASSSWWQVPIYCFVGLASYRRPRMWSPCAFVVVLVLAVATAEVYLDEKFSDGE